MHYRLFLACAAAGVVIIAGCGSSSKSGASTTPTSRAAQAGATATTAKAASSGASASTPKVDPCALLTDADVNAAFALSDVKSPIQTVKRTPNVITSDTSSCDFAWSAANGSASNFGLYVYPASIYEGVKGGAGGAVTVPEIPGAYKNADGYFVAAGPVTLSITGVASVPAAGKLLQEAAAKVPKSG